MRRVVLAVAVVGLAGVLGWGLASPHVREQPPLEIPLYEGAQIDWTVHLTSQELSKQLDAWVQELAMLTVSGYRIEGERAVEVLNFYDQKLSGWRQILWAQPSESGGVRIFAQGRGYLSVIVSKKYEATDLMIATAQAEETPLEAPIAEDAELQWQLVLAQSDLLDLLKRWFQELSTTPPTITLRLTPTPERSLQESLGWLGWLGWLGIDALFRVMRDFSELNIIGYRVERATALEVLNFYEQQLRGWRRNLWIKPDGSEIIRVFTQSDAQGLQELMAFIIMPGGGMRVSEVHANVIVLHARR
ncbi:MAG: hypothetical protein K6T71_07300 [Candidatus Bipolaricaulota bacterium]|nr:hypothetical protein [Candidatus Bipolaricaulota bacterium]